MRKKPLFVAPLFAKVRHAWRCVDCGHFTVEFRGQRVTFCPNCNGALWEAERFTVYLPTEAQFKRK